jgi:hypothetical protein
VLDGVPGRGQAGDDAGRAAPGDPQADRDVPLGAHLHLALAVALLLAAIAGALLMAAAGTARIIQLRRIMRRDRRNPQAS